MSGEGIETEQRGKILIITMNRPKVNAINHAMSRALYRAFHRLQNDHSLMVGVLASANPRVFSAGWDLKDVAEGDYRPEDYFDPVKGHGPGGFAGIVENWELNKPVIAAVQGAAVGGGFEMTLACDVILASPGAYFQLPELARGFLPDAGGMQRLPKMIPPKVATAMLLTGRAMPVEEAKSWGIVHDIVPGERLMAEALALAEVVAKSAPLALQAMKAVLRQNENLSSREALERARPGHSGLSIFEEMSRSEDFFEGSRAFVEKREPRWKGQ
jgi:crotonobetainyl-CoA hydratase